jgi:high affinity cAMP-specific and IBMX-insensitive 3',5'-cyclic phosphodiesterase 8
VKVKVPTLVSEMLTNALDWDFEIFRLEELTEKQPLVFLGMELFRRFEVFNTFNCDEGTFHAWLMVIESHYHNVNTYHNSTHAADVMQVHYFLFWLAFSAQCLYFFLNRQQRAIFSN